MTMGEAPTNEVSPVIPVPPCQTSQPKTNMLEPPVQVNPGYMLGYIKISMRKPCCEKKDTNKGAWSKEEDRKLIDYIQKHGKGSWRSLPEAAGLLRCGKSCRLRWLNYLRPDLKRGNFAEDEEDLIVKLHALLGNRWSLIAGRLPGRTDNEVKNYWNSHLKRKLIKMGINPDNHNVRQSISQNHVPVKAQGKKDQLSSEATFLVRQTSELPDLNLNLNLSNNIME